MFKKLKSLFVVEVEGKATEKDQDTPVQAEEKAVEQAGPANVQFEMDTKSVTGEVDNKFLEVLFGAMEASNLDGFDYLEFKEFLRSLDQVGMDESTKYKSAFATAQTMGASLEALVKSTKHYLDILKAEEEKFNNALQKQRSKILDKKQSEIQRLNQLVEEKTQKIEVLKQEIQAHEEDILKLKQSVSTSRAKVEKTKNDFFHTYNVLVKEIQDDLQKIRTHLQ